MSDVDGIVELFKQVFDGDFSCEWWKWKYLSNPAGFQGEEGDIWIAETCSGKVVGHWAVIPEKIKLRSNTLVVAQAVDAATSPDYRGCGIFRTLVGNVCSHAKNRYDFVFGFPNEIYRGYEKLGWKSFRMVEFLNFVRYDSPLRSYFRSDITSMFAKATLKMLRVGNYLSSRLRFEKSIGDDVKFEEITEFTEEINDFWKLARAEHEIVLERDQSFLNWRFSKHFGSYQKFIARSDETGRIVGYIVFKKTSIRGIQGVLDIVDLHTLPFEDKSLASLIEFSIDMARRNELNIIHCRIPKWHKYARFLRKLNFVPIGRAFEYANLYQPRLITYPLAQNEGLDVNRWFYALADTDYA
jgi:GNAT superfamily N-acetyltransferase